MHKTLIISAFPGCGKTWMSNNYPLFAIKDSDSSKYPKIEDWFARYVDDIENDIGKYDVIFVFKHNELRKELNLRRMPFVVVAPNNAPWVDEDTKRLIKQQWFGRFALRDNSHIGNLDAWLEKMIKNGKPEQV